MQGPPALGWLDVYREPILVGLIVLAAALFVVTLLFSAYAVILRWHNQRREALRAALAERWQPALLDLLAHPEKAGEVRRLVEENRRLHFVGFVLQVARRMRGDEVDILRQVVRPYMGLIAERLHSDRVEVRARAVQTLGALGLPEHEDAVAGALDDPSPLVAMVAARALAKEENPRYAPFVLAKVHRFRDWNRPYLASMLAEMGPELGEGLRRGLADERAQPWARSVMAEALRLQKDFQAGDVAAEVAATTDDKDLLVDVLRLLSEVGRPEHLPVIRPKAKARDPAVRALALKALGRLGGPEDVPMLLEALDDEFTWAALYAARGVRESGGRHLLQEEASKTDDRRARLAAQVLSEDGAA
ncbi:MAG TPA: HEAT repeat domain-containing protein [Longimicrobiales bacterium]|nr:HEAT repeat domain-containing protein [Longimicrobiales bacterium]